MKNTTSQNLKISQNESRVKTILTVKYKTIDSLINAYTENISKGGLYIKTPELLPLNSIVKIKLSMPQDGPEIECTGQVAKLHKQVTPDDPPTGMAIILRDFSEDHRLFIENYICELTTRTLGQKNNLSKKLSILVVDDDKTVRTKTQAALTRHGHTVQTAEDGLKGLSLCLKNPPDLILADVQMPRMDGWNFLKTIRSRSSLAATWVIFQTSLKEEKDRLLGYKLGVDDYISKPYSIKELISRIEKLTDRSTNHRKERQKNEKSLKGALEQVSISTVLSLLEMERKTGVIDISGPALCQIYIKEGRPFDVCLEGEENNNYPAIIGKMIKWQFGQFEFMPQEVDIKNKVHMSMQGILLEATRINDENTR